MSLLAGGSVLAAFLSGSVALFSPCCIVFMLPAYLSSAVKGRRWALFPLTLVFAAGVAAVILPLTLGVGLLASALTRYHLPLYLAGGTLMVGLGVLAITGRAWSPPPLLRASPDLARTDAAGVAALGVFSGVASSCCAPVLAGVLTLSVLAGSVPGSLALGGAYVTGMVFPLFLIALAWDRLRISERGPLVGRPVVLRLGPRRLSTTTTGLAAGATFVVMGIGVAVLALTGNPMASSGVQVGLGRALNDAAVVVVRLTGGIPEAVLGLALLGVVALVVAAGLRSQRRRDDGSEDQKEDKEPCHGHHQDASHGRPAPAGRAGARTP